MKPKVITIEGRFYRCFEIPINNTSPSPRIDDSKSQTIDNIDKNNNVVDVEVEQTEKFAYKHSFYVPSIFHRFIIGQRGENHKRLESDTKTVIKVSRSNTINDIVINGSHLESIVSARHRIDTLVENSRSKLRPTHFISIPMTDPTIASNYRNFKIIALNETAKDRKGVHEGIFQKPEKMHLTLGMLTFIDDNEVKAGVEAFQESKEKIIKPIIEKHGPIKIKAQGLGCFDKDTSKLRVLYGTVSTENDALQELADNTAEFFREKGMMKKERGKVNLHMTLMNSSFAIDRKLPYHRSVERFDARSIMEVHKDHLFGEILLSTIHICSLQGPKTADGYYEITSKIVV